MIAADDFECHDEYISSGVLLPQDGEHRRSANVISCAKFYTGNVIGVRSYNPILDTCVYDVMLPYG